MTTVQYLKAHVLPAAYALLPANMQRIEATALLMAIALQESRCEHRCQILNDGDRGPARGFWQFEVVGVNGLVLHRASSPYLRLVCNTVRVTPTPTAIHAALETNDILAAACARLLLWTSPKALPGKPEWQDGWDLYLQTWRPGKPHPATWQANFAAGWAIAES